MNIFYLTPRKTIAGIKVKQTTKQIQPTDLLFWNGEWMIVLKRLTNPRYSGHPYEIQVLESPNMTIEDLMIYQSELKEKDEEQ